MSIENFNDRSDIYRYFFFDTFPTQKVEIYFLFWASTVAFTNRLVRKPPLGPQKNNIIVRKGWRFIYAGLLRTITNNR